MPISFTKVKLPNGWLGNMSRHAIVHLDVEWATNEHLFQALRFADPEIREAIRTHRSPMAAKFFAKKHRDKMVVEPQSERDLDNMRLCLRLKVEQHPDLKYLLLASGEEEIIEDCTSRQHGSGLFWGAARQEDGSWRGENVLGKLWMELRTSLRAAGV